MIKKQIFELLNEIYDEAGFDETTLLLDEGILDSMSLLYLVTQLEEKNGIKIPMEEVTEENFKNISAIERLVEELKSKRA